MEEDYNWNLILKIAIPIGLIEMYIFYTNISNGWKWFLLIIGQVIAGLIVYKKDKRKGNVLTTIAIIFLMTLIIRFLKNFGFI